ncbi:ATP-binding protein [Deinococcus cellulosilyticus]|uniref:histidine kinase n=1 Tax=Deinococcus cellulosilyticus (strain DSM 18568 / NBRC 106333 / KACC 11606 / 5516J-15) TaxID=1223518 RepID=A0A511N000_DEIC1|nr:ATP-binding protein [Deinococcus cellulosilyticus]GEM46210.1 hypothetical protein DC3_18450 [Deinococcus cellulosilyticus NBRC 106333 = KACC 11606]
MNRELQLLQNLSVHKVLDVLPDPAWISNPSGEVFLINQAYRACFQTEDFTLERLQHLIPEPDRKRVLEDFRAGIAAGTDFTLTFRLIMKQEAVWHELKVTPIHQSKTLEAWMGILHELRETEGYLEALMENAPVGLGLIDQDYRVRLLNSRLLEDLPFSRAELQQSSLNTLYQGSFHQVQPHIDAVFQRGEPSPPLEFESQHPVPGRPPVHWRVRYFPVRSKGQQLLGAGFVSDNIRELKEAQKHLEQERAFLQRLTDEIPATIQIRKIQDYTTLFSNRHTYTALGYTREEVDRMTLDEVLAMAPPEDLPRIMEVAQQVRALQPGESIEDEYRLRHKDGGWRWFLVRTSIFEWTEDGEPLHALSVGLDITDRKQAELQLAESEQRLQGLIEGHTRFVSDTSHEIKTPLAGIQGNLEVLLRYDNIPAEEKREIIQDCYREAVRLGRLVTDLLSMARTGHGLLMLETELRFDHLVLDTVRDFESIKGQHELKVGEVSSCTVLGDPDRLKQLLVILTGNALKYTPDGGTVTLTLECHGDEVELVVKDTGIGIRQEDLPKVFERYFRADHSALGKDPGGTGLGLPIARWIVEQHGGQIVLESESGKGTTVRVRLPACPLDD